MGRENNGVESHLIRLLKACSTTLLRTTGKHVVRIEIVREPSTGEQTLKIHEGQHLSGELWMHWNLQQVGRKTRTVVHVHSTHIVAAMYAGIDLQAISRELPEIKILPNFKMLIFKPVIIEN